jgi:hypothetical protein
MTRKEASMSHAPCRSRFLPSVLLALAAALAAASPASGQAVATATPADPGGKPTRLHWAVDGMQPPVSGRFPASLVFGAPGFRLDERAVVKRCAKQQATLDECPAKSRVGAGRLTVIVYGPRGRNEVPLDLKLYRGAKRHQILAITRVIDIRVRTGTLQRRAGSIEVTFSIPAPPALPGVSYEFKDISADLGASRRVTTRVGPKGHKKRRTVRYSLVHTPTDCAAGSWAAAATLTFPDATTAALAAPITCAPS